LTGRELSKKNFSTLDKLTFMANLLAGSGFSSSHLSKILYPFELEGATWFWTTYSLPAEASVSWLSLLGVTALREAELWVLKPLRNSKM